DTVFDKLGGIDVVVEASCAPCRQDLTQRRAWPYLFRREAVDLGKASIGEHHTLPGIEQAHALRHVVDGRIEALVLRLQLFLALLQEPVLARQLRVELLALADVLMGDDPAAVRPRLN